MKLTLGIWIVVLSSCNLLSDSKPMGSVEDMGDDAQVEVSCFDSLKNGDETDLNCGGSCRPCTDSLSCLQDSDCVSTICKEQVCSPAQCNDQIKNGSESDVDCGGNCNPCADGSSCIVLRDCVSQICENSKCLDPCPPNSCGGDCTTSCLAEPCDAQKPCEESLWCDGVCKTILGWKRTITFNALAPSEDFYAYVRVPEFVEAESQNFIFKQDGQRIPSEAAEEVGSFWVYIKDVQVGENRFSLEMNENVTPELTPMWADHIAVLHSPGVVPIIAQNIVLDQALNVQSAPGRFGSMGFFDGTAFLKFTGTGVDDLFPVLTISAWIMPSVISETWLPIVGRQFSNEIDDDFSLATFLEGKLYGCISASCLISADPIALEDWTLVTLTYDGTRKRMYINGELALEGSSPRNQSTAGNFLTIGGGINESGAQDVEQFFKGGIDELRFSAKVQSGQSIRLQYLSAERSFYSVGEKQVLVE